MRKALLILAAAAIVAAPAAASAKHRRHHHRHPIVIHAPDPSPFQPGWRAFWTGFDTILFVPIRTTLGIPSPWG